MENRTPLDLTTQDLSSIEQYRLRRQTSVLVILFTDIKGFTEIGERRGERHAVELLRGHDEIVVRAVEEGGAGLVVKHIGDSVMAVFAEPSTAVERALRIQEETAAFNEAHPDLEDLGIRIGLHMGQVAVENQAQLDLVGRHVNRASRVEALADILRGVQGMAMNMEGRPASELRAYLAAVDGTALGPHLQEFEEEIGRAVAQSRAALTAAIAAREKAEADEAEL